MVYTDKKTTEISFPLGGIGTGSIGLAGNGSFVDFEIFNRPAKGSLNADTFFAIRAEYPDGKSIIKLLQGDYHRNLIGKYSKTMYSGYGYGPNGDTMSGFAHFEKVKFEGKFPLAKLTFSDKNFPAKVTLQAFNPFIPHDSNNSSIPCAFFEVRIKSLEDNIKFTLLFTVKNPFEKTVNEIIPSDKYTAVKLSSFGKSNDEIGYGDMTLAIDTKKAICKEYWQRKGKIRWLLKELSENSFSQAHYDEADTGDLASVGVCDILDRTKSVVRRFVLSWNVPNNYNYWSPYKDENGKDIIWKNYYATLFDNSVSSAFYSLDNWNVLYKKTKIFCDLLHNSTLDKVVIDAVASNLSVLKTPTVLRLEDGTFYGWEGLHEEAGSCEGTCTHVWSYQYALPFLFPDLERSVRDTEFKYDTEESGRMQFRTMLPLGRQRGDFHPCVDGQMATVFKIYRDWKLTGNTAWLKENWENVKKILEFAWSEENSHRWDRDKDGVLEGRQHHTLDRELFGPSAWLEGMYLAALKSASEMADYIGDEKKKSEYSELFEKGYKWTKENLFNQEYFYHRIDLKDKSITDSFGCSDDYWNEDVQEIRHQIGEGCALDQLLGQWHANVIGLGDIFDKEQRKTALKNIFKNNFKDPLREFTNIWRVFALGDEAGAIICEFPQGKNNPMLPILYVGECMTGFEYAFAGLLISEGFIDEGLKLIKAIRHRYDGEKRNPYNEIECGSNYARSMASFALLPIFLGFEFDAPHKHIGFNPILKNDFKSFWATGKAWGDFCKNSQETIIKIYSGTLDLESIALPYMKVNRIYADKKEIPFTQKDGVIHLNGIKVNKELQFI